MKVKVITCYPESVENKISEWLIENENIIIIKILQISYIEDNKCSVVLTTIFYSSQ